MPIKVKKFGSSKRRQGDAVPEADDTKDQSTDVTVVQSLQDGDSSSDESVEKGEELVIEESSASEEDDNRKDEQEPEGGREGIDDAKREEVEKREPKAPKKWIKSSKKKTKIEICDGNDLTDENESKKKDKMVKGMETALSNHDNLREEENVEKMKKSKKQKTDIKKAFRNFKSRLGGKRKSKNEVQEISIKPETETPQQCWASDSVSRLAKQTPNSSRTNSAESKTSKSREEDDDGIEVIYDAAYQGGESE